MSENKGIDIFGNCIEVNCPFCNTSAIYVCHKGINQWSCMNCHKLMYQETILKLADGIRNWLDNNITDEDNNKPKGIVVQDQEEIHDDDDNDDDSLSSLIELSLIDRDAFCCENCHYDSEVIDHSQCKQEIIVYPCGYEEWIACKCDCNKDNWENEADIDELKKLEGEARC